ncbi:MAG TPA: Gfo/Idh/MocA family oxidoreductase [Chthonomonadales bacterium]|nr:Gfo/Idh/MocA family oxidoreductase [Chthonomonadales bacterium]
MSDLREAVRIGIIGCGQIAQHHLTNYSKIPDAAVVACADIDRSAADSTAERYGIPSVYYSGWELLKRDDLTAIDICLHNNLHMPATVAALEAGKHVYCEKPMAGTYRDAETMLRAAESTGRMLHIQLGRIYSDECRAAMELIKAGELGDLYHGRSTGFRRRGRPFVDGYGRMPFVQKHNSGGGALYDMGVYHISEMLYLLSNPAPVRISGKTYQKLAMDETRARESGYSVEELGLGFVRLDGDLTIDVIEAWAMNLGGLEGSSVLGTKGGVCLEPFRFYRSVGDLDLNAEIDLESASLRWRRLRDPEDIYGSSQRLWVAALQGRAALLPTASIALNTMLISEGIYISNRRGEEVSAVEVRECSQSTPVPL